MRGLRRLFGQTSQTPEQPATTTQPAAAPPRRYASTDCPHCGQALDPLPKAKKKCPHCGQPMYVRSEPDGLTYLLREADLEAHEQRWEAQEAIEAAAEGQQWNDQTREQMAQAVSRYAELGVRRVEFFAALEDSCPTCRALAGRVFELRAAPTIPVAGCTNQFCRCDYLPIV